MSELRHLQMVILGIMRDIDALCQKNNIEYYLLSGTAIGAIRHKDLYHGTIILMSSWMQKTTNDLFMSVGNNLT